MENETNNFKPLQPGQAVSILPAFRDSDEDAAGWVVVEDRGDRVLIAAVGLLAGSAVSDPQTLVGREMIEAI